jgi:hypothetical protein
MIGGEFMTGNKKSEVSQRTGQTMSKLQIAINQCALLPKDRLVKSDGYSLLVRESKDST